MTADATAQVRAAAMMSQPAPKIPRETERKTLAKILVLPVHPCQVRTDWLMTAEACATPHGFARIRSSPFMHADGLPVNTSGGR